MRDLLVLNEARLPEVLLALLLLLGLVVGDVGGVAPLVVAVVALHHVVVLGLLHHLHLVDTPLTVGPGGGGGNSGKGHINISRSLTLGTAGQGLRGSSLSVLLMVTVVAVGMVSLVVGVEGESSNQRLAVPGGSSPQLPGPQDALASDDENKKQLKKISHKN